MLTFDSIEKFNRNKKKQILFILIHHLYLYIKNYEFSFKSLPFIKHKSMWRRIFVFIRMNEWKQMMMMIKSLYDHLLVHFTTTAHCYWISFFRIYRICLRRIYNDNEKHHHHYHHSFDWYAHYFYSWPIIYFETKQSDNSFFSIISIYYCIYYQTDIFLLFYFLFVFSSYLFRNFV